MAKSEANGADERQQRRRRSAQIADENTISIAQRAQESERETTSDSKPPGRREAQGGETRFDAVPERILDRYYRIDNEYFLDNGELAFTNHGTRLSTRSDNAEIARDMVEFARHNRATAITVTGSDRFRQEAWAAAQRAGLAVEGFKPDEHQKRQLVRQMAREGGQPARAADRGREPEAEYQAAPPPGQHEANAQDDAKKGSEPRSRQDKRGREAAERDTYTRPSDAAPRPSQDRLYYGKLLDYGAENYQRSPHEDMSFFVQIDTPSGPVELWGKDLERALRESKSRPKKGDEVAVLQTGQKSVTVQAAVYDEKGAYVGKEEKSAQRNEWQVEKKNFFDERQRLAAVIRDTAVTPKQGATQHPQLAGTYTFLREAELFAQKLSPDPAKQRQMIEIAREEAARSIERGDALPTTRLRQPRDRRLEQERAPAA